MPLIEFQKSEEEVNSFFESMLSQYDCLIFESSSNVDQDLRSFNSADEIRECVYQRLTECGLNLLLCPSTGSVPTPRAVELKSGEYRKVIEGCGLFNIQLLPDDSVDNLITGKVGYFSEAGARAKYFGPFGPDTVNWRAHEQLSLALKKFAKPTCSI